jgi:hypothetical protein
MPNPFPQPSKLLAVLSAIVIAADLSLVSAFIAASIAGPGPFAILGGFLVLPICLFLAAQQYRGTFRRVPSAAQTTSVMLYIVGAFLLFGVGTSAVEALRGNGSMRQVASIFVPVSVVALGSIAVGRMNALWFRTLSEAIDSGAVAPESRGFSIRELLVGVGVIAAMLGITFQLIRTTPPTCAEGIDAAAAPFDLPAGATDISYSQPYSGIIAFEFTTNELAFREWVNAGIGSFELQSAGVELEEITSPFTITRYFTLSPELSGPHKITIDKGLCYSWSKEDRGVYAAFDRATGRAYYHSHSR